jgi:ornithine cyclodeaminase
LISNVCVIRALLLVALVAPAQTAPAVTQAGPPAPDCRQLPVSEPTGDIAVLCQAEEAMRLAAAAAQGSPERLQHLRAAADGYARAAQLLQNLELKVYAFEAIVRVHDSSHLNDPRPVEQALRQLATLVAGTPAPLMRLAKFQEDHETAGMAEHTLLGARQQYPDNIVLLRGLSTFFARRVLALLPKAGPDGATEMTPPKAKEAPYRPKCEQFSFGDPTSGLAQLCAAEAELRKAASPPKPPADALERARGVEERKQHLRAAAERYGRAAGILREVDAKTYAYEALLKIYGAANVNEPGEAEQVIRQLMSLAPASTGPIIRLAALQEEQKLVDAAEVLRPAGAGVAADGVRPGERAREDCPGRAGRTGFLRDGREPPGAEADAGSRADGVPERGAGPWRRRDGRARSPDRRNRPRGRRTRRPFDSSPGRCRGRCGEAVAVRAGGDRRPSGAVQGGHGDVVRSEPPAGQMIPIIEEAALRAAVTPALAVDAVREAFRADGEGRAHVPGVINLDIPSGPGEFHIKTAHIEGVPHIAVKIASGFYDNPSRGLPSGSGMIAVFDAATGFPSALLLDNGFLTDIRTGAAGAIAADVLARATVDTVGVIGSGVQARWQIRCLREVRSFSRVVAWSPTRDHLARFCSEMRDEEFDVTAARSLEEVCAAADILITTTPSRSPLVRAAWLREGMLIVAVGSDTAGKQELDAECLQRADLVVVDRLAQCAAFGELKAALDAGLLTPDRVHAQLGEIVAGRRTGRTDDAQIAIADLTGVGFQDTAIAAAAMRVRSPDLNP